MMIVLEGDAIVNIKSENSETPASTMLAKKYSAWYLLPGTEIELGGDPSKDLLIFISSPSSE